MKSKKAKMGCTIIGPNGDNIIKKAALLRPVKKAETFTSVETTSIGRVAFEIERPYEPNRLELIVRESDIIPQCIRAMSQNVAGFGLDARLKDGVDEEDAAAIQELEELREVIEGFCVEKSVTDFFKDVVTMYETFGYSYAEVLRNEFGEVSELRLITNPETMAMFRTVENQEYKLYRGEREFTRNKKFRKFRQMSGGETVWFKEFLDPRVMDLRNGEFLASSNQAREMIGPDAEPGTENTLPIEYQANEIWHFKKSPLNEYGIPKWEGLIVDINGALKARYLNWNYFVKGRHTPLAVLVKGGTLTDKAYTNLQTYLEGIEGEAGQHKFLLLEATQDEDSIGIDGASNNQVEVELVPLASILQEDGLFQNYLKGNRQKVQSSYNLPDLFVGFTEDFNVATAREAKLTTEEQTFQPDRLSLAWVLNNLLLSERQLKYTEAYFRTPSIDNTELLAALINAAIRGGGITPNQINRIISDSLNQDYVPFDEDWADTPIEVQKLTPMLPPLVTEVTQSVSKAGGNDPMIAVLKDIKKYMKNNK